LHKIRQKYVKKRLTEQIFCGRIYINSRKGIEKKGQPRKKRRKARADPGGFFGLKKGILLESGERLKKAPFHGAKKRQGLRNHISSQGV
jgi:hypothetical protein